MRQPSLPVNFKHTEGLPLLAVDLCQQKIAIACLKISKISTI
jgi:hypothetical protein